MIDAIWDSVRRVRARAPLVHNVTNYVVMNNSANALLALGASPAMVHAREEVEDFVAISQALVVNIGTLSPPWVEAMRLAAVKAAAKGVPWVLDPVGAGATAYRRDTAAALAALRPSVIRGNASEVTTLAGEAGGEGRGVDATVASDTALGPAAALAAAIGSVVAVTGATDHVTDGRRRHAVHNGHPLMARVTGLGCSLSAVTGAFLAVTGDAFAAATHALAVFGVAGEMAAEQSPGPGSLQWRLLDALHVLDRGDLARRAKVD